MIARQSALGLGFLCKALPNRLSHLKLCIAELIEQLLSHQMVGYRLGLLGGADAEAANRRESVEIWWCYKRATAPLKKIEKHFKNNTLQYMCVQSSTGVLAATVRVHQQACWRTATGNGHAQG